MMRQCRVQPGKLLAEGGSRKAPETELQRRCLMKPCVGFGAKRKEEEKWKLLCGTPSCLEVYRLRESLDKIDFGGAVGGETQDSH